MIGSEAFLTWPAWLQEVMGLLAVHPQFVLSGNVRDRYVLPPLPDSEGEEPWVADTITVALGAALRLADCHALLVHDIVDGYEVVAEDRDAAWADAHALVGREFRFERADDLDVLAEVVRAFASGRGPRMGLVLDYASRLTSHADELDPPHNRFFASCLKFSHEAAHHLDPKGDRSALYNAVFWIVDREHDLPAWLTARNQSVRAIQVPWPTLEERETAARLLLGADRSDERAAAASEIAMRTDGMNTASLFDLARLFGDQSIDYARAEDAVRTYTYGAATSPWRGDGLARRLRDQDVEKALSARILGQEAAVTKAADILRRAVLGLSGAQSGSSSRPRGVLFFAGPTGVGKTQLAKALTELVFGSPEAYVRFDMSEFSERHTGERLTGAPPGYTGFESGGELTNAVRRRPYSLLLFDEIEKAHPLILDKFLQLLDDGRVTDGRGTTVYFSDTIIVFTSNLGLTRPTYQSAGHRVPTVTPADSYDVIADRVTKEIRRHFTEQLNRPELLNRIGDNLVVFDFIRERTAPRIADFMLGNIIERVEKSSGITVEISRAARLQIHEIATADLSFGGRGIGNKLESFLVNPLARALFALAPAEGTRVVVEEIRTSNVLVPEVVLR